MAYLMGSEPVMRDSRMTGMPALKGNAPQFSEQMKRAEEMATSTLKLVDDLASRLHAFLRNEPEAVGRETKQDPLVPAAEMMRSIGDTCERASERLHYILRCLEV